MFSSGPLRPPLVFVSYSHDSPTHMDRVLALCDRLRRDGIDAEVDQYDAAPREGWPRWTLRQIEAADFVLVVCTETYRRRFDGKEEKGRGQGVAWEGAVVTQVLYDSAVGGKFVPVVFSPEDEAHIPTVLRGMTRYNLVSENGYEQLYRYLTGQPAAPRPDLGPVLSLPPKPRESRFLPLPVPAARRRAWPRIASSVFLGGALALGGYLTLTPAEKQVLQGEILDAETRRPLPGVLVRLPDLDLEDTTDGNGKYRFEVAVRAGTQVRLRATKDGYESINVDPPAGTGQLETRRMWRSR
jgi:SEFIR domain